MKLLVKLEGGPSPGVSIVGESKDLVALADRIKAGATAKAEGCIGFSDVDVKGEPYEWIEFEVVKDLAAAHAEQKKKAVPARLGVVLFVIFVLVVGYLAYRGYRTL